jgi:type IV pilus assembly protein PilP
MMDSMSLPQQLLSIHAINRVVCIVMCVAFLTACQKEKGDLNQYMESVKAKQKVDIPPLPVLSPYVSHEYAASELRDPFTPTMVVVPEDAMPIIDDGIKPDAHRQKEILEAFELENLQLVGTLQQETMWGLVRSPDGVIHRVKDGNYLGKNHGQILRISTDSLFLKEILLEENGSYTEQETSITVVDVN